MQFIKSKWLMITSYENGGVVRYAMLHRNQQPKGLINSDGNCGIMDLIMWKRRKPIKWTIRLEIGSDISSQWITVLLT